MAVHVDWWVEYSDHSKPVAPSRVAVSTFTFTDRQIFGIAAIAEVLKSSQCFFTNSPCWFESVTLVSCSSE